MPAPWRRAGTVRHVFTHFELTLDVYAAQVDEVACEGMLRDSSALAGLALPSVMRKCVDAATRAGALELAA